MKQTTNPPTEPTATFSDRDNYLSKCCKALLSFHHEPFSTNRWVCGNCNNFCDVVPMPISPFDGGSI